MKKKENKWVPSPSTRDYLYSLYCFPNFTRLLESEGKPYEKMLKWLLDMEKNLNSDDYDFPTMGEIAKMVGLSTPSLTKQLKSIYDAVFDLNYEKPLLFKKEGQIPCNLQFRRWGVYANLYLGLDLVPRVGEVVYCQFMKPRLDCATFYVTSINHDLNHKGQQINIALAPGKHNNYLHLLKEKAYLKGTISLHDFFHEEIGYSLQQKLLKENNTL